ncbi:hypothetical protein AgCh_031825 [Apium graveolens]
MARLQQTQRKRVGSVPRLPVDVVAAIAAERHRAGSPQKTLLRPVDLIATGGNLVASDSQGVHKLYPRIKPIYSEAEILIDSVQGVITRLREAASQNLWCTGKSWDVSDDENHEYLAFIAISEDGPTHISQDYNRAKTASPPYVRLELFSPSLETNLSRVLKWRKCCLKILAFVAKTCQHIFHGYSVEYTTYRAFMVDQQKVIESLSAQFNNSMLQAFKGEINGIDDSYPSSGMAVYNTTHYFNEASQQG